MSRLLFQWTHSVIPSSGTASRIVKDSAVLVRIPRDLLAFDVRIRQPNRSESVHCTFLVVPSIYQPAQSSLVDYQHSLSLSLVDEIIYRKLSLNCPLLE
jgi:hypothetical protein